MLRRLTLRDFVIVPVLVLDWHAGFTVLTGETGAGKSILVDALQLVLGSRAEAGVVREGAKRAELSAEFDLPADMQAWLDDAGFEPNDGLVLLRRTVDAQGKSRAWINGSPATVAQLREVADALVDIHGQHAWQSLTRPSAVRALLDDHAGIQTAALVQAHAARQQAEAALAHARAQQDALALERDRLAWQIAEVEKLSPAEGEWADMGAEHQRLAHAQGLIEAARQALDLLADGEAGNAEHLTSRALDALEAVQGHDVRLLPATEALHGALAQLRDAAHTLNSYLDRAEVDPARLAELDNRMSTWMGLARRWRRPPDALPALLQQWRDELGALSKLTDLAALEAALARTDAQYRLEADRVSAARAAAAGPLARSVTQAMQQLGMAGGRFEVALTALATPHAQGLESVEFMVAGHAGSSPRPLAKVASGGELSRLALAIAVSAVHAGHGAGTLIFDEVDAGIGGAVGDTVGALLKQLGQRRQVLAVTHLAQVAACADHHLVVTKALQPDGRTASAVTPAQGEARVAEVARMLGGERMAGTSLAHAEAMLQTPAEWPAPHDAQRSAKPAPARKRSRA